MAEKITTYDVTNIGIAIPTDRDEFYSEQVEISEREGKPSRAAGVIAVFLFNSHGEIFIQKRAYTKNHNPGLFDKSIGGHIQEGDTPDYTTMVETIQEMQTPSMVLKNRDDFLKTFNLLKDYLKTVSIIQYIKTESNVLSRVINQKKVNIANVSSLYFGVYDGRIRPVDRRRREFFGILLTS